MGGQSSGSSGQLRNKGEYGDLESPEIQTIYNLKIKSAKLITMPLKKGMNYVNMGLDYIHYGVIPFTPYYLKFVHIALDLILENNISVVIEYGCYLTKISKREKFENITNYREPKDNNIIYYYPFKDGISFYIIKSDDLIKFYEKEEKNIEKNIKNLYNNASEEIIKKLVEHEVCHYNLFIIYKNLYNTTLEESIKELILHTERHQVGQFYLEIKNKIKFFELIEQFSDGWTAEDYNIVTHNCQDFAGKVINILKAYRPNEKLRQLLYEIELPRVVVDALKENESEENSEEVKKRRIYEKIPLYNLYYVYKYHSELEEYRKNLGK